MCDPGTELREVAEPQMAERAVKILLELQYWPPAYWLIMLEAVISVHGRLTSRVLVYHPVSPWLSIDFSYNVLKNLYKWTNVTISQHIRSLAIFPMLPSLRPAFATTIFLPYFLFQHPPPYLGLTIVYFQYILRDTDHLIWSPSWGSFPLEVGLPFVFHCGIGTPDPPAGPGLSQILSRLQER